TGRGASRSGRNYSLPSKSQGTGLTKKSQGTTPAPAKSNYSSPSSSSRSTFSDVSGGGPIGSVAPAAPAVPTEVDYLKGDSTYQATLAALKKQLHNFTTDVGTQRSNRELDYNKA